jgi:CheY-like chemotaxis protein
VREVSRTSVTILMADDDEDDREMTRDALHDAHLANVVKFTVDGQDLMEYLRREGSMPTQRSMLRDPG